MSDTSFPDDIERLLTLERNRSEESAEVIGRLRDRLSTTIGSFDTLPDTAHDPSAMTPSKEGAEGAGAEGGGAATTTIGAKLGVGKLALVALGAFSAGAVSGAKWQENRVPAPTAAVAQAAPASPASAMIAPSTTTPALAAPSRSSVDIASLPVVKPSAVAPAEATGTVQKEGRDPLAAERTLIDVARTASARGKWAEAAAALDEHAVRFPRGSLSEEREGLRIQLLIAQGNLAEARERATRFRKNFPTSLMLPAIDAQLGTAPAP